MITKADKSNAVVIINRNDYETKVDTFLKDNKFKVLTKDPTIEYSKTINSKIMKCKSLTKLEQNMLKSNNSKAPILRGQPKTHKTNIPIRPVVNFQNAPSYKLSKFLDNKIKNSRHSIKNTYGFIKKIKDIDIPENSLLILFDVCNMYTNIPTKETLTILRKELTGKSILNKKEIEDIIELTQLTLKQNYFSYNSSFYLQEDGVPMGSPLSGIMADIFMKEMETTKIMNDCNPYKEKIQYWYRYVDDIICLFKGNENEANNLLKYINSLSPKIQFTGEIQKEQ